MIPQLLFEKCPMLPPGGARTAGRLLVSRYSNLLTTIAPHMTQAATIPTLLCTRVRRHTSRRLGVREVISTKAVVPDQGPLPLLEGRNFLLNHSDRAIQFSA
jgi:hypothetical protein